MTAMLGIAALVGALAGCVATTEPAAPDRSAETVASADCLSSGLRYFSDLGLTESADGGQHPVAPAAGAVPDGFPATQAILCTGEMGTEIDGEMWSAVRETRYDGDLEPLISALAVASDAPTDGPCTADYEIVPELWLVTEEGEALRAAWPVDACGKTKPGVRAALDGLDVIAENILPIARVSTDPPLVVCSELPGVQVGADGTVTDVAPTAEPVPGTTSSEGSSVDGSEGATCDETIPR
ncbi:hypothetical protein DDQ50_08450 [Amnibacterium flavum]|uniref:Lipoprotein n=1 Tax=Amnibacterium flavum TaxID=2173173 RepID=A0A2V1HRS9_9MICO|nr:hypothetical protein DDQ50_08450 [Amnibacterium flavum]